MMNYKQTSIGLFILLIVVTVLLIICFLRKVKKVKNQENIGFPDDLSWKDSKGNIQNDTLDIASLSSVMNKRIAIGNNKFIINLSDKPSYFPNGVKVAIDETLVKITTADIHNEINKNNVIIPFDELIKKFNSSVDVKDIKDSIEHYSDLIHDFLIRHPKANDIWKNCYNNFVLFLQGNPTDKINIDLDINEIYNGIKIELTRIGGVSGILKRFQHRIKYDMIQAIANNDPEYRQVDTTGEPTGSGKCTAYPLSWWQNCPAGKAPVGSRGWNSNGACNKWYQHISGELLCSDYKTNFDKPIKGPCVTAIGILDPSEETRRFVSNTLTSILDIVGLYPGAAATLKTISCIFTLALPIMGDWEWILKDLKDVCYNYICDGNTTDKVCGGAQKYCVPRYTDSEIANRDCSVDDTNCNKTVNGICTDELPKNEIKTFTTSKQHVLKPSNFI